MSQYKDKLLEEVKGIPEEMASRIYKIVHLLKLEFSSDLRRQKRGSLRGIWKGSKIDEDIFAQAKESLFPYEYKN